MNLFRTAEVIAMLALASCAQAVQRPALGVCPSDPEFVLPKERVASYEELVEIYRAGASAAQKDISIDAAQLTESEIGTDDRETFRLFYVNQLRVFSDICGKPADQEPDPSFLFVEMMGNEILKVADLYDAPDQLVDSLLPFSELGSITARANIVVLSASCSRESHPRLDHFLSKVGLRCQLDQLSRAPARER
jgi:hypothetical protein